MKKLILVIILSLSIGCASGPKPLDPNYQIYQQAIANQKPLVSIEWSEDGSRIKKLDVNPQVNIQQKVPDAPHPAWAIANNLIKVGGVVGGIWAGGQALEGIVEASRGTTVIDGSYNTSSTYSSSSSSNSSTSSGGEGGGTPTNITNINDSFNNDNSTNNSHNDNSDNSNNDSNNDNSDRSTNNSNNDNSSNYID
jgi:hypothetical protein